MQIILKSFYKNALKKLMWKILGFYNVDANKSYLSHSSVSSLLIFSVYSDLQDLLHSWYMIRHVWEWRVIVDRAIWRFVQMYPKIRTSLLISQKSISHEFAYFLSRLAIMNYAIMHFSSKKYWKSNFLKKFIQV